MIAPVFHAGERALQARAGVDQRMAQIGPRVIRDFMPEQHRAFFGQLPFVIAGTVDAQGQPWASVLAGPPGFLRSPHPQRLDIKARPLPGDPLEATLAEGAPIGLLGLEPHTRRRNRMNGIVHEVKDSGFSVEVSQSFGNCPKYIQAREPLYLAPAAGAVPVVYESLQLDDAARRLITGADTFFIATAYAGGVDVSHRGGRPGFVRVAADGTLTVPDYAGNYFFNTLGNIAVNPRAGLLFIDVEKGDLLYLAVAASIIWDGPELREFDGAQRLLRMQLLSMRRIEGALPLRWGPADLSPYLPAARR
jgi:predicted pyridoxine 5'-phosphate oxidase superfamily flavin-nucleotide-binding protein